MAFRDLPTRAALVRWEKLLAGRSAQLFVTLGAPLFWRFMRGAGDERALKRSISVFCGVRRLKPAYFESVKTSTLEQSEQWLERALWLGAPT